MYKIKILLIIHIIIIMSCSNQQLFNYYPLKSAYELKWENITPQQYDYTCGAAALSTLIYGYFGEYISEKKITLATRCSNLILSRKIKLIIQVKLHPK